MACINIDRVAGVSLLSGSVSIFITERNSFAGAFDLRIIVSFQENLDPSSKRSRCILCPRGLLIMRKSALILLYSPDFDAYLLKLLLCRGRLESVEHIHGGMTFQLLD